MARRLTLSPLLSDGSRCSTQEQASPSGLNLWHPLPFSEAHSPPTPPLSSPLTSRGVLPLSLTEEKVFFLSPSPGDLEPSLPCYCQGHGMPRKGIIANPNNMLPPSTGTHSPDPPVSLPGAQQGLREGCHASSSSQRLKVGLGKTTGDTWGSSCEVHVDHVLEKGPVQMRPIHHPGPEVTTRGTLVARRSNPAPEPHLVKVRPVLHPVLH